jgi:NADPH:quinone reductase-like Zn-dependent oxidoreductase
MKAAVCTRYGPPEVVVISEVEKPATGDNGLLVKVHATTVNRTDCAYRATRPFFMRFLTGLTRPRSAVLGTEFAGVVEAVGSGVTSFRVGDKVFGYNEGPFGAHAEYMSTPVVFARFADCPGLARTLGPHVGSVSSTLPWVYRERVGRRVPAGRR